MIGGNLTKLNWNQDGTKLLSVSVGGNLIYPKEFARLAFSQNDFNFDVEIKPQLKTLEESYDKGLVMFNSQLNVLMEIIRLRMSKIKKDYC